MEPSVYMIEWLWDLERLPGVRRTLHFRRKSQEREAKFLKIPKSASMLVKFGVKIKVAG